MRSEEWGSRDATWCVGSVEGGDYPMDPGGVQLCVIAHGIHVRIEPILFSPATLRGSNHTSTCTTPHGVSHCQEF